MSYKSHISRGAILIFLLSTVSFIRAQNNFSVNKGLDDKANKPKIYLLGVFHFAGEKVDANTTPPKWAYKSLDQVRQKEIEQLRGKLMAIKPTVICVEIGARHQSWLDSVYTAYCNGAKVDEPGVEVDGEITLLAFEVGKRLGLKKINAVDARPMAALQDEKIYDEYLKYAPPNDQDSLFDKYNYMYDRNSRIADSLRHHWSTLKFIRHINTDEYRQKILGRWLITTRHGTNSNPIGADQFITRYYNRNIRIYSNIQRSIESNKDRVLVIYGNTHMTVLRPLFLASPLYNVIPAGEFLK